MVQAYKPDPRVYRMAVNLRAAQAQGMQAAFVPRPLERGPSHLPDLTPDAACEVVAADFMDLAQQLGAG